MRSRNEILEVTMSEQFYQQQTELTQIIERHLDEDGKSNTNIQSLFFSRFRNVTGPHYGVHTPSLCIIAQGTKEIRLAQEHFKYGPTEYLLTSIDLPITGQVVEASPEAPYLAITLEFTASEILEVLHVSQLDIIQERKAKPGMSVNQIEGSLLDAVIRLTRLLDHPTDIPILAPLIKKEIIYRLLQGNQGSALKQMAVEGSVHYLIHKATQYILQHYQQPFRIEDLAKIANLSVSSFHRQFKEATSMSPIQFQKQLRLQEARRLLFNESADAADVAFRIGYESPSQFSREYSRMFGFPPKEDIKRFRHAD